ncbi:MAG: SRPBCC family protein [Streptosporangiaceae bacterium]
MDLYATLLAPVDEVFARLGDPGRLGDWLPEVSVAGPASPAGDDADFTVTIAVDGARATGAGEVTASEPPWLAGYRLFAGERVYGLRVTCAADRGGTRVHIHQSGDGPSLTIDLARLARAIQPQGDRDNPC